MNSLLASKTTGNGLKIAKTKQCLKNIHIHISQLKHWPQIIKNTQDKVFSSLLNPCLPSISKWSPLKVFSSVILLLLTLRTCSSVWNLKKMSVISVYWFAVQQQTSTERFQKSRSFYSKFSAEENELTPSFQNPQEMA